MKSQNFKEQQQKLQKRPDLEKLSIHFASLGAVVL